MPETDRLQVTIQGEDHEIFASFGLVSELASICQSAEGVAEMDLNPNVAMMVLDTCLVPRDKRGRAIEKDFMAPEMDSETAENILTFAGEHALSFFVKGLRRSAMRLENRKRDLQALGHLLNSTPASGSVSV